MAFPVRNVLCSLGQPLWALSIPGLTQTIALSLAQFVATVGKLSHVVIRSSCNLKTQICASAWVCRCV